jgi:sugar phosphate isomerase/epimerase
MPFRYAICNETFDGWDHARACDAAAAAGYTGLEVAPFTMAPLITQFDSAKRAQFRKTAEAAGVPIIGLHWLLAKTQGFQVTSPDAAVRTATAEYLGELTRACRELGGDLMVFGSPLQRKIPPNTTYEEACGYFIDTLEKLIPHLEEHNVSFLLEPLARSETDFLLTAQDAVSILDELKHSLLGLHLDVKAMCGEVKPINEIITDSRLHLRHFHANDANRRGPGFGEIDFVPIFDTLKAINYPGWVSVEVFDYSPDPETIARDSISYMQRCAK